MGQVVAAVVVYCQVKWLFGWRLAKKEGVVFVVTALGGVDVRNLVGVPCGGLYFCHLFAFGLHFFRFLRFFAGWDSGESCVVYGGCIGAMHTS